MKRIISIILIAFISIFCPLSIKAMGGITASPSSLTIEVGSTKSFTISATNTIGDVSISSSNSSVASLSSSSWGTGMVEEGQTKTGTITVTGVSVGTSTITLVIDAATFDSEDLSGQTRTISVNVVAKQTPVTPTTPTPQIPSTNNSINNSEQKKEENNDKSKNNNLKDISIDGYNITKVDNNNYTLSVSNDVTSININVTAEDNKAKVLGNGKHDINIGDNNIEITITSESGEVNKINIRVNRKDAFYLDDLDAALKNSSKDISININSDSKLSSQNLTNIKNSGKIVKLNYYNDDKKLLYSWILDGSKIKDFADLDTNISFTSENIKEISRLSNYADGIIVNLKHRGIIPKGTKLKIYIGNKYEDDSLINIYSYDSNKINIIKERLKVKDGYVEFDVQNDADYFVTMSKIGGTLKVEKSNKTSIIILVALIIIIVSVITAIVIYILKSKKSKNNNINSHNSNVFPINRNN